MKTLKRHWQRIPRPLRACLNLLSIGLLLVTFYVSVGAPTLRERLDFRRLERANLVGPSEILLEMEPEDYDYTHLILAETDAGVITYVSGYAWGSGFNYHEKTGDVTLVTAPYGLVGWGGRSLRISLPVFVVDDHPEALRAEVDLDIVGAYALSSEEESPLDHHYTLSARREQEGFFRFSIDLPAHYFTEHGPDGYALDLLAKKFTNYFNVFRPVSSADITATVRLYDSAGQLIARRELTIAST